MYNYQRALIRTFQTSFWLQNNLWQFTTQENKGDLNWTSYFKRSIERFLVYKNSLTQTWYVIFHYWGWKISQFGRVIKIWNETDSIILIMLLWQPALALLEPPDAPAPLEPLGAVVVLLPVTLPFIFPFLSF